MRLLNAGVYRADLIERHLPLVHYIARRFVYAVRHNAAVDYDDLVGYGTEGLIYAAERFDPSRGFTFSTFAGLHIRTTIQDALRVLDSHTPSMRRRGAQIEEARTALAHEQGAVPTDTAVATALGLSVKQVRYGRQQTSMLSLSLEAAAAETAERGTPAWLSSLADRDPEVDPAGVADRSALRRVLVQALATLPDRERQVILDSYVEGTSLRQIAVRLGVSEGRVSQLRTRALQRLRLVLMADQELAADQRLAA